MKIRKLGVLGASLLLAMFGLGLAAPAASANTSITVTNLTDSDPGSLRDAINQANTNAGADTISFDAGLTGTISLLSALPDITDADGLTIQGPGADQLTISGGGSVGVFVVDVGASLTVDGVTVSDGNSQDGGGFDNAGTLTVSDSTISNNSATGGGGIFNDGTLTVTDSTVADNTASNSGGGISNGGSGAATIDSSTISGNSASGGNDHSGGGGIDNAGTLTLSNSTVVNNTANGAACGGGGIENGWNTYYSSGTVTNSTIAGNRANGNCYGGGGYWGGGIVDWSGGGLALLSSILDGNTGSYGANCVDYYGYYLPSDGGYNISSDATCGFSGTSLVSTDPMLDSLADNGGPTQTMALLDGSPAIDSIPAGTNGCGTTISSDQRGLSRPQGAGCDAGAFEVGTLTNPVVTIRLASPHSGTPNGTNGWFTSGPVTGTVRARDFGGSASDIASIDCTSDVNGGGANPLALTNQTGIGTSTTATGDFSISDEGTTVLSCTATDASNTSDPRTKTVNLDTVAPDVSRNASADSCDIPGNAGWCLGTQTAGFTATDSTSGLSSPCSAAPGDVCDFTNSTTTNGDAVQLGSGQVCDVAGNCSTDAQTSSWQIDSGVPTVSPKTIPKLVVLNGPATADPGAVDPLVDGYASGLDASSCDALTTTDVGLHTVSCTASDVAGNSVTQDFTYLVRYNAQFISPTRQSTWHTGQTVPIQVALTDYNGLRISDAQAQSLRSPTCYVKVEANGPQTMGRRCMRYDTTNHQFYFNLPVGTATGSEQILVNVLYPNPANPGHVLPDKTRIAVNIQLRP